MHAEASSARRHGTMAAWLVCCLTIGTALVRATTTAPAALPAPPDERTSRRIFESMAASELSWRARAAANFPNDLWSQDDDFHAMEAQRAAQQAANNHVALGDVLGAIDDGMRSGWKRSAPIQPTVAPCRPRPVY